MSDQVCGDTEHCAICTRSIRRVESRHLTQAFVTFLSSAPLTVKANAYVDMACYCDLRRFMKANNVGGLREFLSKKQPTFSFATMSTAAGQALHQAGVRARRFLNDEEERKERQGGATPAEVSVTRDARSAGTKRQRKALTVAQKLERDALDAAAALRALTSGSNTAHDDKAVTARSMQRTRRMQEWLASTAPHSGQPGAYNLSHAFLERPDVVKLLQSDISHRALQLMLNLLHGHGARAAGLTNALADFNATLLDENIKYDVLATKEGVVASIQRAMGELVERYAASIDDRHHHVRAAAQRTSTATTTTATTTTTAPTTTTEPYHFVFKINIDKFDVDGAEQGVVFHLSLICDDLASTSPYASVLIGMLVRKNNLPNPSDTLDSAAALEEAFAESVNGELEEVRRRGVPISIDGQSMRVPARLVCTFDMAGNWKFFLNFGGSFKCFYCNKARGYFLEDADNEAARRAATDDADVSHAAVALEPAFDLGEQGVDYFGVIDLMHSIMCIAKSLMRNAAVQVNSQSGKDAKKRRAAAHAALMEVFADITHTTPIPFEQCVQDNNVRTFKMRLALAQLKAILENAQRIFDVVRAHSAAKQYGISMLPLIVLVLSWIDSSVTRLERDALHADALKAMLANLADFHLTNGSLYVHMELVEYKLIADAIDVLGVSRVQLSNISSEHAIGLLKKGMRRLNTTKHGDGGSSREARALAAFNFAASQRNFAFDQSPAKKKKK